MSTRSNILKYALLPGFIPRLTALLRTGFTNIAFIIAVVYGNVGLLPPNHAYLSPQNIGRFGLRHVMAEAANNLVLDRKHIDQIIIYFTILIGLMLLGLQFILLITAILAQHPALAFSITDFLQNPNTATGSRGPEQDIAFIILDRVFGVTGFFKSCISTATVCTDLNDNPLSNTPSTYPFPFHLALHQILAFYSYGIFWVGAIIIVYLFTAIVAETAQSGTPFGQRFNKAWAPLRLILFFALITPLGTTGGGPNQGLNGAQLITLKIVQLGSNLGTNTWTVFNGAGTALPSLSNSYLTQQYDVVAQPNIPEVNDLLRTLYLARSCAAGYHLKKGLDTTIDAYLVRAPPPAGVDPDVNGPDSTPNAIPLSTVAYSQAKDFYSHGTITVRFGKRMEASDDPLEYKNYKGNVKPLCGEVLLPVEGTKQPGANMIINTYYRIIIDLWTSTDFIKRADCLAKKTITNEQNCTPVHDDVWALNEINTYSRRVKDDVQTAIRRQRTDGDFAMDDKILKRGWAGAAIWYNKIAEMNGAVTSATLNIPKASRLPALMDIAARSNSAQNQYVSADNLFSQNMADILGLNVRTDMNAKERDILTVMVQADKFWTRNGAGLQSNFSQSTGNLIIDFANSLLGTSGLFEMRKNTNVHPLAQLSALGKGMIEAVARNAAYGIGLTATGTATFKIEHNFGASAKNAGQFLFTLVIVTIGIATILYYVLPFLPFIYFMFAISGWIKSIFEAIVAMPLWALAHLRIDGEGLAGPGATNGYFLLLEIFLRPTLIIIGFIASVTVFAALVDVLNQIFDLVIANLGGYDEELEADIANGTITDMVSALNLSRGPLDEFFFTAMYAITCYLMALACFKLVDLIPNNIMRWMGVSVSTFQENAGDPAGKLTGNVYKGSLLLGNQIQGVSKGDFAVLNA